LLECPFDIRADKLVGHVANHGFWLNYLSCAFQPASHIGLHLAVFTEPFFALVLEGRKTIESRFSRVRCAPFEAVSDGDIILIKQAGGPICGLALARQAWSFELDRQIFSRIREQYGDAICADDDFWRNRRNSSYATLIELAEPTAIPAMPCSKRDRRGWVPLRSAQMDMEF
jgi:hypothetical protein